MIVVKEGAILGIDKTVNTRNVGVHHDAPLLFIYGLGSGSLLTSLASS